MKRYTAKRLVLPWMMRTMAVALIPPLLLTSMPVQAWVATNAVAAQAATRARPLPGLTPARPRSPHMEVNRTRPQVTSRPPRLVFSAQPTEAEISRARAFDEPLLPVGGHASAPENKALAKALLTYSGRVDGEDVSAITAFLARYPRSAWRAALLTNLGLAYRRAASFSKALTAWEEAWRLAKNETHQKTRAVANRAVGELADLYARLGRDRRLEALLAELAGRDLQGPATERITAAREGLWLMRNKPAKAFRCGPYALGRIQMASQLGGAVDGRILNARTGQQGMSLTQLHALAADAGMPYQMTRRPRGAPIPLPAVVHWRVGHYAALIQEEHGRYLLQDPALGHSQGDQSWISPTVLDAEASGYFLIPEGSLPESWRTVGEQEGRAVWGRGFTDDNCPDCNKPCDKKGGGGGPCPGGSCGGRGMAFYAFHLMLVSLNIVDTPVGYFPPRGPWMGFTVTYNQREANQPANFSYANLGPKWTFDWLSYITDNPAMPAADVRLFVRSGGTEPYTSFNPVTQSYAPQLESRAVLVRTSPTSYERRLPDGSREIFSRTDGATAFPRKIFMTSAIDPAGNTIEFVYDDSLRLVSAVDALGQVTTLAYALTQDPLKITSVVDPFGRQATFEYDAQGRLVRITDVIGITSEFSYEPGTFINTLTTPYGTTRFSFGEAAGNFRWLQATDPLGDTERVEFRHEAPGIASTEAVVPAGIPLLNDFLQFRNSFYWDKEAWARHPGDYTKAHLFHWLHDFTPRLTSGILESEKKPLENRVWYRYPGQSSSVQLEGSTHALPSKIARVLDDGTTQLFQYEYNSLGKTIRSTDPSGREFSYVYDPNQIDLLEVRQTRGTNNELLARYTYNDPHQPLTETDSAGQTTTYTYNGFGQPRTRTNPRNETTTWTYNDDGYLQNITGPVPGATTSFTYDTQGRVQTVTDSEGYTVQYDYDALDRRVQKTFPDGTFKQYVYNRLDLEQWIDRLGRVTRASYNARQQPVSIQDPQGRTTQFDWCRCGGLQKITDARGQQTVFEYDVQGRISARVFPDGRRIQYRYENTTSRMKEIVDANGQNSKLYYYVDGNVKQIRYAGVRAASPPVSFTYDDNYNRVSTMRDGTGLTTYTYHPITPPPSLGAGQVASISGPLPNSTITYIYDELGRVLVRAINGVPSRTSYDALGRVSQVINPLGTFDYSHVGTTMRLNSIRYPNGQVTTHSYYDNLGDHRLQQIRHQSAAGPIISQFNYTYDAEGRITTWSKQADAQPPTTYAFDYDNADQLIGATLQSMGARGGAPSQFVYEYDPAGNRTREQIDDRVTLANYNNVNQLISRQGSALPDPDPVFRSSEIVYDGLGRRVRVTEKEDGVVTSDKRLLWCGSELCEERDATGATVTKRFYTQGAQINGINYFYTQDHLGSLREMTDGKAAVRARYDYDPYGRRTKISGDLDANFGFTGLFSHIASELNLAVFRAYDAELGRWLSRDPIGEAGGLNLYGYVINRPLNRIDPLGLSSSDCEWNCSVRMNLCTRRCSANEPICITGAIFVGAAAMVFGFYTGLILAGGITVYCVYRENECFEDCVQDATQCRKGCPQQCPAPKSGR